MALLSWDPFTTLARLDDEFDELMRRTWGGGTTRSAGFVPAVDMVTDGPDVLIKLELPGLDPSDVDIEVRDGRLVISGERRADAERTEDQRDRGKVLVRELHYGAFRREFALPAGVSGDDVDASYDRGMLEVRVRNVTKPEPQPTKVPIRTAAKPEIVSGATAGES